jgi:hypothetical protein
MLYFLLEFIFWVFPSCYAIWYVTPDRIKASPSLLTTSTLALIALASGIWVQGADEGYIYLIIFAVLVILSFLRFLLGGYTTDWLPAWYIGVSLLCAIVGVAMVGMGVIDDVDDFNPMEGLRLNQTDLNCISFVVFSFLGNIAVRRNTRKQKRDVQQDDTNPQQVVADLYMGSPMTKVELPIKPSAEDFKNTQCSGTDILHGMYDRTSFHTQIPSWVAGVAFKA